jgi:hypothetical protein
MVVERMADIELFVRGEAFLALRDWYYNTLKLM